MFSTDPEVAFGEDGKTYYIKGKDSPTAFAEIAGCRLAALAGLKAPNACVGEFAGQFYAAIESVPNANRNVRPWLFDRAKIANPSHLFEVIAVDTWLVNDDRNMGNLVGSSVGEGRIEVYMIDFEKSRSLAEYPHTGQGQVDPRRLWPTAELGGILRNNRPIHCPQGVITKLIALSSQEIAGAICPVAEELPFITWHQSCVEVLTRRAQNIATLVETVWGELVEKSGKYWVLSYAPLPESGERVALALVVDEGNGRIRLDYDATFGKVLKLYPDADSAGLAFQLERLRSELRESPAVAPILNSFGPQLEASPAKRIGLPLLKNSIDVLMTRYILPAKRGGRTKLREDPVSKEIQAFVRRSAPGVHIQTDIAPVDVLGISVAGAKRIAMGIRSGSGWTLIDGIDLNTLSPTAAIHRADDISRSFWNYGRVADTRGIRIRSVGVVLNGNSHLTTKTHEAHDYALHRFESESDLAVDAASTDSRQRLTELLQRP